MGKTIININWNDSNFEAYTENEDIACVTTGNTLDEVKANMIEALEFHRDGLLEDNLEIPEELKGEIIPEWKLSTSALLHYTDGIISRKAIAAAAGINIQQLTHYASGWRTPRPAMKKKILDGIHKIGKDLIAIY